MPDRNHRKSTKGAAWLSLFLAACRRPRSWLSALAAGMGLGLLAAGCGGDAAGKKAQGEALIRRYCSSCHLPVYPALLDSATWIEHTLPAMAPRLGIAVWRGHHYFKAPGNAAGQEGISLDDWRTLVQYFREASPRQLATVPAARPAGAAPFRIRVPDWPRESPGATTTLVAIDGVHHLLYSGDEHPGRLLQWGLGLHARQVRALPSPAVGLSFGDRAGGDDALTCIGTLPALNLANGQVFLTRLAEQHDSLRLLAGGLPRPVQALGLDADKDGVQDWLVCAFGHDTGSLSLWQAQAGGGFRRAILSALPGAEQAVEADVNGDGWTDVVALFAQAREGLWLFLNDRHGGFRRRLLLEWPPVYGSTGFQLADFNGDGKPDILYTCGDNADYSQVLKPYHGIYLYLNEGGFRFREAWHYALPGCTRARAADFDGDGDLDIAAIAFFGDFRKPPADAFHYLEQTAPLVFRPRQPGTAGLGRWLCMDVGDADGDGDPDIVLGNYARGFMVQDTLPPSWDLHTPLIFLENVTR